MPVALRTAPSGSAAAVAAVACLAAGLSAASADVKPLTLYQKTARAMLVVRARATSDSTRRPLLEVLEVYKGVYPGRTLAIVPFVQDYANPKPWLRRETFRKGEECVLFLNPHDRDEDQAFERRGGEEEEEGEGEAGPGREFVVLNADQGKVELPPEGAAALTQALKRIVEILSLRQHDLQAEALRGLVREENPYLAEAGLEEVVRFELATEEDVAPLARLLRSEREDFRAGALRALGQIGGGARRGGKELRNRPEIFTRLVDRAYGDPSPRVRRVAVRALGELGGEGVEHVLRAVGAADADQGVRYEAQVALLEIRRPPSDPPK